MATATATKAKRKASTGRLKSVKPKIKKAVQRLKPIKEKQTRVGIYQWISDETGLKRVDVESVLKKVLEGIKRHMMRGGSGEYLIPPLGIKLKKVRRKATKKRVMVSPLTGEEVVIPAKPARYDIKVIALKPLKEAVEG